MTLTVPRYVVVQNAYVVDDLDKAIVRFTKQGFGPWLLLPDVQVPSVTYRGEPGSVSMSAALTQAGDVQIELVAPLDNTPSCFRDLFGRGESGLHHTAMFPDDWHEAVDAYETAGFPCANLFELPDGGAAAIMDTSRVTGHMTELYRDSEGLRRLNKSVRDLCATQPIDVVVDAGSVAEAMHE
jgi:hypothetical protein